MNAQMKATISATATTLLAVIWLKGFRAWWWGLVRTATAWRCSGMYTAAIAAMTISGGTIRRSG